MQHRSTVFLLRLVALLVTSFLARPASANGRYPGADEFLLSPAEPQTRFVHGSFGFFLSKDAGATWHWVCDDVIEPSLAADSVSPSVAVFERGALAVATVAGVKTSTDDGCSFVTAPGTEGLRIRDIAKARHAGRAVAVTAPPDGAASTVVETTDDGVSWHVIGTPLPIELVVQNIEVTDTDPDRLYVSGTAQFSYDPGQLVEAGLPANRVGVVYTSRDRGTTWTRTVVPQATSITSDVYVSAVDPSNADLVYARSAFAGAGAERDGVVLVSHDGAMTFDVALRAPHAALLGFALSPTGDRIAVALANADGMDGTWVAPRDTLVFEHRAPDVLSCLSWGPEGLFACQNLFTPSCNPTCPYVVASSTDDARTWTPLLTRLGDIVGPLDCPAASAFPGICLPVWESTWKCKLEDCDAGAPATTPDAGVASGVTAGASGCDAPGTSGTGASLLGAALLVLGVLARGRRRVSSPSSSPPSEHP